MNQSSQQDAPPSAATAGQVVEEEVVIPCQDAELHGILAIPQDANGIVLFAHGSGSSRHSPRNHLVAEQIRRRNLATLLFDLLTVEEEREDMMTGYMRFDIELLAKRLLCAKQWVSKSKKTAHLGIGYFGSSTGGAAALVAAAENPDGIHAVVSRGGRPDLAHDALPWVDAPSLLIVGEKDQQVLELNERAFEALYCEKELDIVPGATHLFEEPGALEQVAAVAADWFQEHVVPHNAASRSDT